MSKIIELIRPEQAIKGLSKENAAKSGLHSFNEITTEIREIRYDDMIALRPELNYVEARDFGNLMSQSEKFIIPEIFPLATEKNFAAFQRFALPMWRNFASEHWEKFSHSNFRIVKTPIAVKATRNYVAFDFYPYWFPCEGVNDLAFEGILIAFDAGAATKARFWKIKECAIAYHPNSFDFFADADLMFDFFEGIPTSQPLFECDVVPYERNYIYLFYWTTLEDLDTLTTAFNSTAQPQSYSNLSMNDGYRVYCPKIRMELFSEDYSAQRFESGLNIGFPINPTENERLVNISNEKCVYIFSNNVDAWISGLKILEAVPKYRNDIYPNAILYYQKEICRISAFPSVSQDHFTIKIAAKSTYISSSQGEIHAYIADK